METESTTAGGEGSIPFTRSPLASSTSVSSLPSVCVGSSSDQGSGELTNLDLFSGIGGFALAAKWAGFETVAFCEKEPYAQQILVEKFGAVLADADGNESAQPKGRERKQRRRTGDGRPILHPDIFALNGTGYAGVTLITGGFPCQPYSLAGQRRGSTDDRHLWPEMRRVIDEARPSWVLGENVPGIISLELDGVLSDLEGLGYACWPVVVPACAVDARHRRDRVWLVAYAADRGSERGRSTAGSSESGGAPSLSSGCGEPELFSRWPTESGIRRVSHGIPHRAHRLKGLGNAIVPQVADQILRLIADSCRRALNQPPHHKPKPVIPNI